MRQGGGTNMRSSLHSSILIAATFVLCLCLGACKHEQDEWPALLQNLTASGGYWGACPPKDRTGQETLKTMGRLGTSPELDARLNAGFLLDRMLGYSKGPLLNKDSTLTVSARQTGRFMLPTFTVKVRVSCLMVCLRKSIGKWTKSVKSSGRKDLLCLTAYRHRPVIGHERRGKSIE